MRGRASVAVGLAVLLVTPAAQARRQRTAQVTPPKHAAKQPDRDRSRGGERKGGIEFAMGSVTAALSGVLLARGIWELVVADRIAEDCAAGTTSDPTCTLDRKPGLGGRVAGGLSLAFAVPLGVASGFLFRHAVRIRRDAKRFEAQRRDVALSPWLGARGGGVGLRLRF